MNTVVLITCTKNKHTGKHKAEYLYSKSPNFQKYLECSKLLAEYEDIFVISALHYLVPLNEEIEWYDYSLNDKTKQEINAWGRKVAEQLNELYDLNNTRFIIIADENYYMPLTNHLTHIDTPLEGVGCGPEGYNQLDEYVVNNSARKEEN